MMGADWQEQRRQAEAWYENEAVKLHYRLLEDWDMERHEQAVVDLRLELAEKLAAIARAEKGQPERT